MVGRRRARGRWRGLGRAGGLRRCCSLRWRRRRLYRRRVLLVTRRGRRPVRSLLARRRTRRGREPGRRREACLPGCVRRYGTRLPVGPAATLLPVHFVRIEACALPVGSAGVRAIPLWRRRGAGVGFAVRRACRARARGQRRPPADRGCAVVWSVRRQPGRLGVPRLSGVEGAVQIRSRRRRRHAAG